MAETGFWQYTVVGTPCRRSRAEVEVAAVPGEAFGPSGYLRFSYATSDEDIVEGIGRIKKLLTEG